MVGKIVKIKNISGMYRVLSISDHLFGLSQFIIENTETKIRLCLARPRGSLVVVPPIS